jgi:predicted permease
VHGRLGPGVDLAAARADAGAIARRLANEYPENDGWTFGISPLKQTVIGETRIRTGGVLLGAVGLLLLLSCAGVSNLLMARASSRAAEVGVRAALGAGRLRLMRQFLTESLVLGLVAAGAGIVLAALLMPALRAIAPPDTPRVDEAVLDGAVLLFSLGIALLTSLIFGFAPILHVIRHDTSGVLRIGPRGGNSGGGRLRRALVACQVAMTVALLVAVGLLGGTYLRMQGADVGLPVDTGLAVPLVLSGPRYTYEARRAAVADIRSGLAEIPGVVAVGSTNIPPFAGSNTAIDIAVEGQASSADSAPSVRWRAVGEGFFAALDATASHGRLFDRADFADGAEPVVVLGEALARRVAGHAADAVGRRIAMGWDGTNWRRVVGVVRDVEDLGVTDASPLTFYLPGEGAMPTVTFLVRLATPDIVPPVDVLREAIWAVDATLAVPAIDRLSDLVGRDIAAPLFNLVIVGVFGTVALALAVMGVYGVTWYAVSHRRHEIGIRLALGATPGGVLRPILGQSLAVSGAGVAAGAALAIGLSSYMESLLFQTASRDWRVLLGACAAAVIAAAVATWGPARRASVASPVEALRID